MSFIIHFIIFRLESELTPHEHLKEEAEALMVQLMISVQYTAVSFISLFIHLLISHCCVYSVILSLFDPLVWFQKLVEKKLGSCVVHD